MSVPAAGANMGLGAVAAPPRRRHWLDAGSVTVVLALVSAAVLGGFVAQSPFFAIAFVVAAGIGLLVAANIHVLPLFLVFTMFVESLALGPGLRVGRIAAVLAIISVGYYLLVRGARGLRINALLAVAGSYGLWVLLSAYWATDSSYVYKTMFQWLLGFAYMLTFAVLVRTKQQLKAIFITLTFGSLIFGLISFAAYVVSGGTLTSGGDLSGGGAPGAAGLQGDHTFFAIYQVFALPAALALAVLERRAERRVLYYAALAVIVLSVVASLSRTGVVVLAGVVFATLVLPWRIFFRRPGQRVAYVLALVAAAGVVAVSGSTPFVERVQTIIQESGSAGGRGSGRVDLWRAALTGYHENEALGIGAGNYQARSLELLQITPGVNTTAEYVKPGRFVHNAFLEALTELGVVGLAILSLLFGLTAYYFILAFRRARAVGDRTLERMSIALLVTLFAFAISSVFLSNEFAKPLWILVGLALALDVMSKRVVPRKGETAAARSP
jgi:O-antigen ligase